MTVFNGEPTGPVEQSLEVVVLRRLPDGRYVTLDGETVVLLTDQAPPPRAVLDGLLASRRTLWAPSDVPAEVVAVVEESPVPAVFHSVPGLYEHRVLVFDGDRCRLAGRNLRLHPVLGIYAEAAPGEDGAEPALAVSAAADSAVTAWAEAGFDLRSRPWLPVVTLEGEHELVGLEQVLCEAHRFRRLTGESPTMTAALYRLLLALLHRIYGPPTQRAWAHLWRVPALPPESAHAYLTTFGDRFDLLHPQRPFLQCRALAALPAASPAKLIPYRAVGNNVTLFDHTTASDQLCLDPGEAARWLVTVQAFDPGGMKTPFTKDKSSERAPCNFFGVVLVEGASLKDTLLLNALVYDPDHGVPESTSDRDRPAWEEPDDPTPEPDHRAPRGWTDLLTWPARRVLLTGAATGVDGVVITPGTRLNGSLPDDELMAAFRKPRTPGGAPKKDAPLLPVRLHPLRGVWRHSAELLMTDVRAEGPTRQRPRALSHLAELAEYGHIPIDAVYTLRVFGQQLDSKASVVETWLEEQVSAPVALLRARDETTGALIGRAVALADEAGAALRALQDRYRAELRASPASTIDIDYWPRLTAPFNTFLVAIGAAYVQRTPQTPAITEWATQVLRHADEVARRWIQNTGPGTRSLLAAGQQHDVFLRRLASAVAEFRATAATHTITRDAS
ncbi:type I-E CRISPR-associated protein Cse1/CasA [Kutzneria sp. NPDC052558]|uniref:type I-E CRISPR-associated protein Cse1/CasA n=1 Tax=Kutzneria sp. NPDC052558 TaxID=3364121 RepID=UPI0037CBA62D